jgi:hypothetical protein
MFLFIFSSQFLSTAANSANNQEITGTAKKSLLELEKTFNDQILGELKNGMQSKESIDYKQIVRKLANLNNDIQQVYNKVTTVYFEEQQKLPGGFY